MARPHVMTPARKAALRKAQIASAAKRRGAAKAQKRTNKQINRQSRRTIAKAAVRHPVKTARLAAGVARITTGRARKPKAKRRTKRR